MARHQMIIFFKGIAATWRASVATVFTLSLSATVLGILLSIALGGGEGSEGQGLASSFSIITGFSAILAARGVQMHSYGLRGNLIALLRDIGFSWNRIHVVALAEACLLVVVSFPLSLITGWILAPAVGAYLRFVGLLYPHESATLTGPGVVAALLAMLLISIVCTYLAMRSFGRSEARTARSAEPPAGRLRRFLKNAGPTALLAGIAVLWTAAGYSDSGIGLAFLGALLLFGLSPWVLARVVPGLSSLIGTRLNPNQTVLHTALRWRASTKSVGVTYGVLICILGGTVFGGHFFIADSAARNSWLSLLGDASVSVTHGTHPAGSLTADAVSLNQVEGEITSDGSLVNTWLTAGDAFRLLGPRVVAGSLSPSTEGIIVTRTTAKANGIRLGDPSLVTRDGRELPVAAFIDLPDTVGSYFVVADQTPAGISSTGQITTIMFSGDTSVGQDRAETGGYIPAAIWVANIPAGQIVSNSGGSGVGEAALLMAAPVLLGLTLMLSSRIISKDSQASSYSVLASLGASRRDRRKLALTESILEVLVPGTIIGALAVGVMLWADRMVISSLGAEPSILSVAAIPGSLLVLLWLVDVATELIDRRVRSEAH